ncbi:MAG: Lytic transglycosylase, catalytic [Myxococcaceae bacterium]|nr:Lytic transglycosylase, catalytic [Myxococcaceae bacterium]
MMSGDTNPQTTRRTTAVIHRPRGNYPPRPDVRYPAMTLRPSALCCLAASVLALAPAASAQIWMSRGADGSLHFTNVPANRRANARVIISTPDHRPPPDAPSQVITGPNLPAVGPEVRAQYDAARGDAARYSRYDAHIREAAQLYQIPEALIRAVIKQESDFNAWSVSTSGALGLMQMLPSTAQSMTVTDPFDPRQNVLGGTRYLRVLANTFNGDLVLTLAAYNAGSGAVIRYGAVPPYEETQNYVRQVLRYYYEYRAH